MAAAAADEVSSLLATGETMVADKRGNLIGSSAPSGTAGPTRVSSARQARARMKEPVSDSIGLRANATDRPDKTEAALVDTLFGGVDPEAAPDPARAACVGAGGCPGAGDEGGDIARVGACVCVGAEYEVTADGRYSLYGGEQGTGAFVVLCRLMERRTTSSAGISNRNSLRSQWTYDTLPTTNRRGTGKYRDQRKGKGQSVSGPPSPGMPRRRRQGGCWPGRKFTNFNFGGYHTTRSTRSHLSCAQMTPSQLSRLR
ncbi:hypothetical protein BCR44DRAFT_1148603 [Catenaria anguillulae PL171]|uniref:Uncharacterized protein n=1 Tax=Catenaria anguillulae PL171 TaxID=765915 RepID=A0A1Y2HJ36_9FUNG|nr:hypothetical protein BCR44DRAFT_1148603 [Catenaria anguillulae PL171]